jgi:hypothetical protein
MGPERLQETSLIASVQDKRGGLFGTVAVAVNQIEN